MVIPETNRSLERLLEIIQSNQDELTQHLYKHGAVLFRGFEVETAQDFEKVAQSLDPDLKNDYLGTSPRDQVEGTNFVFTASELPNFYPIMQHCEMSFLPHPPKKLFFYCHTAPSYGGETPICDFRKVYNDLNPEIRAEFERKGVMTVRNYAGPGKKSRFNLFELKSWEQMFLTTNKAEVTKKCKENGIALEWLPEDRLRLITRTPAMLTHPVTGNKAWFNHTQVFHVAASVYEYSHISKRQKRWKTIGFNLLSKLLVKLKKSTPSMDQSMQVLFGDGSEIPDSYVQHLEEVIWKNMSIYSWQKGDVIVIDNFSTSHGRLPYEGKRDIWVCWSA
ncbi:MAG: TauD/TfdA family dioxygenase [Bacteroidia bacterium]|nr:TauD/TfdA family dioxygenase [Bacteroidia bacterium]